MKPLIFIVEDDPDQRRNYQDALSKRDYQVRAFASRPQALAGLEERPPDLAILDVMLGDDRDGGFELCSALLKQRPDLPIIFLTSRSDEFDQIYGLRLGAWDYQTKPVSLNILVERISALLKAASNRSLREAQLEQHGNLQLDSQQMRVSWKSHRIPLTVTECALLDVIVRKQGGVASYDDLAAATRQTLVTNNTLNTHIRHIRQKFQAADTTFDGLENVYGAGYRWREEQD